MERQSTQFTPGESPTDVEDIWSFDFRALAGDLLTRPIVLSEQYLKMIEQVKDDAANQCGADKTWVVRTISEDAAHFRAARLLPT